MNRQKTNQLWYVNGFYRRYPDDVVCVFKFLVNSGWNTRLNDRIGCWKTDEGCGCWGTNENCGCWLYDWPYCCVCWFVLTGGVCGNGDDHDDGWFITIGWSWAVP